jgi:hypothetical protein
LENGGRLQVNNSHLENGGGLQVNYGQLGKWQKATSDLQANWKMAKGYK